MTPPPSINGSMSPTASTTMEKSAEDMGGVNTASLPPAVVDPEINYPKGIQLVLIITSLAIAMFLVALVSLSKSSS